jgi:hypothetical protein
MWVVEVLCFSMCFAEGFERIVMGLYLLYDFLAKRHGNHVFAARAWGFYTASTSLPARLVLGFVAAVTEQVLLVSASI